MRWEDELHALARDRENAYEEMLAQMMVDHPERLLRHLRHYLAEQANRSRLKRTYDSPRLETHPAGDIPTVMNVHDLGHHRALLFHKSDGGDQ